MNVNYDQIDWNLDNTLRHARNLRHSLNEAKRLYRDAIALGSAASAQPALREVYRQGIADCRFFAAGWLRLARSATDAPRLANALWLHEMYNI